MIYMTQILTAVRPKPGMRSDGHKVCKKIHNAYAHTTDRYYQYYSAAKPPCLTHHRQVRPDKSYREGVVGVLSGVGECGVVVEYC